MSVPRPPGEYIPNHMVWAILTTLFCCLPFGIVSIVHAARVDSLSAAGDIAGAGLALPFYRLVDPRVREAWAEPSGGARRGLGAVVRAAGGRGHAPARSALVRSPRRRVRCALTRLLQPVIDGSPVGLYTLDLYTRDSKRGGAWMNSLISQSAT